MYNIHIVHILIYGIMCMRVYVFVNICVCVCVCGMSYTQLKKSDSYLRFYRSLSVLMRIGFKSLPKILV